MLCCLRFVFLNFFKLKFKMDLFNSQLDLGVDLDYDKKDQKKLNFKNALMYINLNMLQNLKLSKIVYLYYNCSTF